EESDITWGYKSYLDKGRDGMELADGPISIEPTDIVANPPIPATEDRTPPPTSCQIKGIGWLICPAVVFLAEITDLSYAILDRTLLKLEPMALPGGSASEDSMRLH